MRWDYDRPTVFAHQCVEKSRIRRQMQPAHCLSDSLSGGFQRSSTDRNQFPRFTFDFSDLIFFCRSAFSWACFCSKSLSRRCRNSSIDAATGNNPPATHHNAGTIQSHPLPGPWLFVLGRRHQDSRRADLFQPADQRAVNRSFDASVKRRVEARSPDHPSQIARAGRFAAHRSQCRNTVV